MQEDQTPDQKIEISKLGPEAQAVYEQFAAKYTTLLKSIRSTPLTILLWGPGPSNKPLYRKRLQIQNMLRELGHAALLAEELERLMPGTDIPVLIQEKAQVQLADLILVIVSSPGTMVEVDIYAHTPEVSRKMLVFVDERLRHGSMSKLLTELGSTYGNVQSYTARDIEECHLVGAVKEKVQVFQTARFLADRRD